MSEVHVTAVPAAPGLNVQPAPAEPLPGGDAFQALLAELEAATEPATPAPHERTDAERARATDETTAGPPALPLQFIPSVPPPPAAPGPVAIAADASPGANGACPAAIAGAGSGMPAREAPGTVASAGPASIAVSAPPDGADAEQGPAATTRVETPAHAPLAPSQAPAPAAPVHSIALPRPVGAPGWAEDLARPVAMLVRQSEHAAELRVTPPELGPIGVRIDIAERTATVVFAAAHPETRTALEQALPRLAEALAESGIALGDARVAGEWAGDRRDARDEARERRGAAAPALIEASVTPRAQGIGQIDVFA